MIKNGLPNGTRVVLTDTVAHRRGVLPPGTEARFVEPVQPYAVEGPEDFFEVEHDGAVITVQRWQIREASDG